MGTPLRALAQGDLVAAPEGAFCAMIPVYVINLLRSPERRAFMVEQGAKAGFQPIFVDAVDGRRRRSPKPLRLSVAETALILSHRKVWRRFLASGGDFAVVLEDDVHLGADFAALLAADWTAPAFDAVKFETLFHRVWLAREGTPLAGRRLRRLGAEHLASAGYLVSRAGARKMLAMTRGLAEPVDHTLFGRETVFEGRLEVWQLDPAAVVQDNMRPDAAARAALGTTLHEQDRARLAQAARRGKPRGVARLVREAQRFKEQIRRFARFVGRYRRERVNWR
jgi:glycosyl transferase family 25